MTATLGSMADISGNPFAAAFRSLAQLFETTSEAPTVQRHLGEYTRTIADSVLAAEDREHLLGLLDALSGDEAFLDDLSSAADRAVTLADSTARSATSKLDLRSLSATLGTTAATRCQAGHEAFLAFQTELTKILAIFGAVLIDTSKADKESLSSLARRIYDRDVPLFLRKTIARFLLSLTSATIIARAEERGEKLPPWLALALAETFAGPFEDALAAITSPNALTKLATLWSDDAKKQAHLSAALQRWHEDAASSGESAYFPLRHEEG